MTKLLPSEAIAVFLISGAIIFVLFGVIPWGVRRFLRLFAYPTFDKVEKP